MVRQIFLVTLQAALAMEALLELLEKSDCPERDLKG
jgi:hypothetical protein